MLLDLNQHGNQLKIIIAILAVYFGVFFALGYLTGFPVLPDKPVSPLPVGPIAVYQLGLLVPEGELYAYEQLVEMFESDFQEYLRSIDKADLYEFRCLVAGFPSDVNNTLWFLDNIQGLRSMGYCCVVGGFNEDQVKASLTYLNEIGMVLVSPAMTVDRAKTPAPNFLSLMPNSENRMEAISQALVDGGFKAAIFIGTRNEEETAQLRLLSEKYQEKGGLIIAFLQPGTQPPEDIETGPVNAIPIDRRCVVSYDYEYDSAPINLDITGYTRIRLENGAINVAGVESDTAYPLFYALPDVHHTSRGASLRDRFIKKTGRPLSYKLGNTYDALWLCSLSYLEDGDKYDARTRVTTIKGVSQLFEGVTGDCSLNEEGDRDHLPYWLEPPYYGRGVK